MTMNDLLYYIYVAFVTTVVMVVYRLVGRDVRPALAVYTVSNIY